MSGHTETQAVRDLEGVWRCSQCVWEIESDDGLQGYCRCGCTFDCTQLDDFKALDEQHSDGTSIIGTEGLDEYESEGLIDDSDLTDAYSTLARMIKDIDLEACDDVLLIWALNEIAETGDDEYDVLIRQIQDLELSQDDNDSGDSGDDAQNGDLSLMNENLELVEEEVSDEATVEGDEPQREMGPQDSRDFELHTIFLATRDLASNLQDDDISMSDGDTSEHHGENTHNTIGAALSEIKVPISVDKQNIPIWQQTIAHLKRLCEAAEAGHTAFDQSGLFTNTGGFQVTGLVAPATNENDLFDAHGAEIPQNCEKSLEFDHKDIKRCIARKRSLTCHHALLQVVGDGHRETGLGIGIRDDELVDAIKNAMQARNQARS